ncbi:hypothetical protein [Noviherbaspirillum cavernae]|nr:hypothetical protein [Noviherbaspirillum cavernae]
MFAALAMTAWLALFGDKSPDTGIAEPVTRANKGPPAAGTTFPAQSGIAKQSTRSEPLPDILALQPRETLIGGAHAAISTDGIFTTQSWTPPPPPPPKPPPPPPSAPPLPFAYLGKKIESGVWEVYLAQGDRTHIVQEKAVIDGIYRIDAIKPPTLSLTYLPLTQVQTLTIGVSD